MAAVMPTMWRRRVRPHGEARAAARAGLLTRDRPTGREGVVVNEESRPATDAWVGPYMLLERLRVRQSHPGVAGPLRLEGARFFQPRHAIPAGRIAAA